MIVAKFMYNTYEKIIKRKNLLLLYCEVFFTKNYKTFKVGEFEKNEENKRFRKKTVSSHKEAISSKWESGEHAGGSRPSRC